MKSVASLSCCCCVERPGLLRVEALMGVLEGNSLPQLAGSRAQNGGAQAAAH